MPIYEYQCQECKKQFELLVSANNREATVLCPHCESRRVKRLISSFAFGSKGARRIGKNCGTCSASDCSNCK